jgi:hypothetical protein
MYGFESGRGEVFLCAYALLFAASTHLSWTATNNLRIGTYLRVFHGGDDSMGYESRLARLRRRGCPQGVRLTSAPYQVLYWCTALAASGLGSAYLAGWHRVFWPVALFLAWGTLMAAINRGLITCYGLSAEE